MSTISSHQHFRWLNLLTRHLATSAGNSAPVEQAGANGQISPANTMPFIIEAVKAYATVGEICEALREVYGTYEETAFA